jgi:hypothetical protein
MTQKDMSANAGTSVMSNHRLPTQRAMPTWRDWVAAEAVGPGPYDGGGRPIAGHGCARGAKRANRGDEQANSQENHTRPDQRTDRLPHQRQRPSEVKQ